MSSPTNEELHAADEALQAQLTEMREGFQRHELELEDWATWRKDVDRTIEELHALQRQVATKEDLRRLEQRLQLASNTVPAPVAIFFGGALLLLGIAAVLAHLL